MRAATKAQAKTSITGSMRAETSATQQGSVEQHRQLQQVHVVADWQRDVTRHAGAFAIAEILDVHAASTRGANAGDGNEVQDQDCLKCQYRHRHDQTIWHCGLL